MIGIKIIILISLFLIANGLRWKKNNDTEWKIVNSFPFQGNQVKMPDIFVGEIVYFLNGFGEHAISICQHTNSTKDLKGKIGLIGVGNGCSTEKHIEVAQQSGAIAIVILGSWQLCNLVDENTKRYKLNIAAMCIDVNNKSSIQFLEAFAFENLFTHANISVEYSYGLNPIKKLSRGGMIFIQVFFIAFFSINTLLSIARFIQFLIKEPIFFTFPKIVFILLILLNVLSTSVFYDPIGYFGVVTNFQFHNIIFVACLIPFTITFISVSINFAFLVIDMNKYSSKSKYFVVISGSLFGFLAILIYLIFYVRMSVYDFPNRQVIDAAETFACIVYGFAIIAFLFRSFVIIRSILSLKTSENDKHIKMQREYFFLCIWITIVSLGYISSFIASVVFSVVFESEKPHKFLLVQVFLFLGFAISSFGLLFLFKPKHQNKKNSNVNTLSPNRSNFSVIK